MKINQLIFTVLASLWLASHASSGQIEQQDINEIRPGITTETDLARRFGPPDTRVVDTRGDRLLHWTKLGTPPLRGYIPLSAHGSAWRTYLGWIFGCRSEQTEESSITCAKFINADIALMICAPERGAVSPNFPHLLSPNQQEASDCPYRPCGALCEFL
jgi:hypothetical protein